MLLSSRLPQDRVCMMEEMPVLNGMADEYVCIYITHALDPTTDGLHRRVPIFGEGCCFTEMPSEGC